MECATPSHNTEPLSFVISLRMQSKRSGERFVVVRWALDSAGKFQSVHTLPTSLVWRRCSSSKWMGVNTSTLVTIVAEIVILDLAVIGCSDSGVTTSYEISMLSQSQSGWPVGCPLPNLPPATGGRDRSHK